MKKTILTLTAAIIFPCVMFSNASDAVFLAKAIVEPHADVAPIDAPQAAEQAFSSTMPDLQILLLLAIGMVGLAGVSRKNN